MQCRVDFIQFVKRKVVLGRETYVKTMMRAYQNVASRFSVWNMVSDINEGS